MKKTALIPARYASTRLPGKLLKDLGGKSLIMRTYEAVCASHLFDDVAVVCDHPLIFDEVESNGGQVVMSQKEHECGTDRIAEVIESFPDTDVVVNVQGDEPFTKKETLAALLRVFENNTEEEVSVASLMHPMTEKGDVHNPNNVKVVVDKNNNALLFSRSVIPYPRTKNANFNYQKHIGIYAFRREALKAFSLLPQSNIEKIEKLENMRLLENGIPIKMILTREVPIGIDTEADLEKARRLFSGQ